MVILGVDYGRKRIGLATGDSGSGFVFPLRAVVRTEKTDHIQAVIDAAKAENATHVVVGMPKRMTGQAGVPGEIETEARAFAEDLKKRSGLAIDVEDERMSTALAKRLCEASAERGEKVDEDSVAACVILESYILRTFRRDGTSWMNE